MSIEKQREVALMELERNLEPALNRLGSEFTFQRFRQLITQANQSAYIDLLVTCQDMEKPFGVAHQLIGNYFRPIFVERLGYKREVEGKTDRNIFGEDADKIVYSK